LLTERRWLAHEKGQQNQVGLTMKRKLCISCSRHQLCMIQHWNLWEKVP
jgi:hypothetical protein